MAAYTNHHMQKVMESMGFPNDGTFVPIANEENKQLLLCINELTQQKIEKQLLFQQESNRIENLRKHTTNCQYSIGNNLKLIDAYRSQLTNEHHMYKIAEHDENVLNKRIKDFQRDIIELDKYEEMYKNEIEKIYNNINKSSEKIQWMKEALMEWTTAMQCGEETNSLIEKYCKEDKQKAEGLEEKRRIIQNNINKQRTLLSYSYKEQKSLEQILERTSQLYRQAHVERSQMVNTWKEANNTMNSREKEIINLENELEMVKTESIKKNQQLKEQIIFYEQQIQNNKEIEQAIELLNEKSSRARNNLTNLIDEVVLKSNELITIKKLLQNTTIRIQQQRQKNRHSIKNREEQENQIMSNFNAIEKLNEKYQNFVGKIFNANERLKSLDEIIEAEEQSINGISTETSRLSNALYRSQQMLNNWKDENKSLDIQITGIESTINNLKCGHKTLEKELLKQTEILYNNDYKITELERRIAKMKGSSIAINPEIDSKLLILQQTIDEKKRLQNIVRSQIIKVEEDMRKITTSFTMDTIELEKLTSNLLENKLCCDGGEKQLKQLTVLSQERLVDKSILTMRVHQLNIMLEKQNDKMYNLEKHKVDLELAISERIIDLDIQKELLIMKRKHLLEELSQFKADIGERNIRINAIRARYDNALNLLGKNEDGSIVTATQIKIETAQEKQILLHEGNALNEKVINAEKDIKAIENTLVLLNYSNDTYKKKLNQIEDGENDDELNEYKHLNRQYFTALHHLKECNGTILLRQQELDDLNKQCEINEKEYDTLSRLRMENNDNLMKVHKEIIEQKSKMERAQRELISAKRAVKQIMNDRNYLNNFEKDLNLKELEKRNTLVLQQLADMIDTIMGMGPIISKHLYEKGLNIPQGTRLKTQMSCRSDLSSVRASEYSLKLGSVTALSQKSLSSLSTSSELSTRKSEKYGSGPSIITIDFPGENSSNRKK